MLTRAPTGAVVGSGNVDACVPTWGSEVWTRELGAKLGAEPTAWHPWTSPSASPGTSKQVRDDH